MLYLLQKNILKLFFCDLWVVLLYMIQSCFVSVFLSNLHILQSLHFWGFMLVIMFFFHTVSPFLVVLAHLAPLPTPVPFPGHFYRCHLVKTFPISLHTVFFPLRDGSCFLVLVAWATALLDPILFQHMWVTVPTMGCENVGTQFWEQGKVRRARSVYGTWASRLHCKKVSRLWSTEP